MKLISTTVSGNCHQAVTSLNAMGLADAVLCMECTGANATNVVLRATSLVHWQSIMINLGRDPKKEKYS